MKKSANLTSFIVLILVLTATICLVYGSTIETFMVGRNGDVETWSIQLQTEQTAKGAFNVSGGSRTEMYFWIRDPAGAVIIDSGRVVDQANFEFTAVNEGEYILNFENKGIYSRTISLEYEVFTPSVLAIPSKILGVDSIVFVSIIVIIGIAFVVIAVAVYKRRKS